MNEKTILETSKNNNEDVSSSETFDVNNGQEVHTSELGQAQQEDNNYTELVEQVQQINQKLDNITNLSIVCMVGIGLLVGIMACNIFSRYFKA